MAGLSSSSSSDRTNLVSMDSSDDGPSEILRIGVQTRSRTRKAERSSLMVEPNNPQKRKRKAIISGPGDFDEETGGKVVTPKNSETNFQVKSGRKRQVTGMDGAEAASIECGCCYWPYHFERMVQCRSGHWFCFKCINNQVHQMIYGGVKAHDYLSCMDIDGCYEAIPSSEIKRALPSDVIEKYEHRVAQQAIVEAKIEGLVYCPFCSIPYEIDKCAQVLDCPNPKCLIASCIQCKKLSHPPLSCEEVEKNSETALRTAVEERMTKAVVRQCNVCEAALIKKSGCNKVRCNCGNTMCYVCRQTVSHSEELPHFCMCLGYSRAMGKRCLSCNRCSYAENDVEDNEALDAREEALKELGDRKSELLDVEIGPPLKRQRRRRHPAEEQGQHMQLFPAYGIRPPPEFEALGDQPTNVVVPPPLSLPQLLRFGEQLQNMVTPPGSPPQEFFRIGNGFIPNMDVPAQLPPQQSFTFVSQIANMVLRPLLPRPEILRSGDQVANGAVRPPPEFFRYDDGVHAANRDVPPSGDQVENIAMNHLLTIRESLTPDDYPDNVVISPPLRQPVDFKFGYQRAMMAIRPPFPPAHLFRFGDGDQLFFGHGVQVANRNLQSQQDSGRDEQPSDDNHK